MPIPNDEIITPLILNGENGLIKVRMSERKSFFSNEKLTEGVFFERYDIPLRVQIGRSNHLHEISPNELDTTYYRDTFLWTRTGTRINFGDGKPGVWVLAFISLERGSFDEILQENIEYSRTFTTIAPAHMDIAAILAGEDHKSILMIARWASVGRFLETVHTVAKEKIPPTKLVKKLSLPWFNKFLAIAGYFSGRHATYHPYKLVKNPTFN